MWRRELGEAEMSTPNYSFFAIFLPKIIKIGGKLRKFWQKTILHSVLRYKVFGAHMTHALTHSLTQSQTDRPDYRMSPAPFFNGAGGLKHINQSSIVLQKLYLAVFAALVQPPQKRNLFVIRVQYQPHRLLPFHINMTRCQAKSSLTDQTLVHRILRISI